MVDKKVVKDGKKKVAKAPKAEKAEKVVKEKGPTIASVALAAIKAGKDNAEVLAEVKKQFPDAKTKVASINWYRNKAREEDKSIPTSRDITTKRNAAKKAEKKASKDAAKKAEKATAKPAKKSDAPAGKAA